MKRDNECNVTYLPDEVRIIMGIFDKTEVIFLKESNDAKNYLSKLRELRSIAGENEELIKKLDKEISIVNSGIYGEESVLYELKNSGMNLVVLQDIVIESPSGQTAQIDYYIITPYVNVILECKNLVGDIEINGKGEFIRSFEIGKNKIREGIYSPVTQNERHMRVLKECKKAEKNRLSGLVFDIWFNEYNKSLIVLANPKTVVNEWYAPKEIKNQVCKVDQLIKRLSEMKTDLKSSKKEMLEYGNRMLALNREDRKEYVSKIRNFENEIRLNSIDSYNQISKADKICPRCGSKLVLRTAQKGKYKGNRFWGCTGYPDCNYIENIQ